MKRRQRSHARARFDSLARRHHLHDPPVRPHEAQLRTPSNDPEPVLVHEAVVPPTFTPPLLVRLRGEVHRARY